MRIIVRKGTRWKSLFRPVGWISLLLLVLFLVGGASVFTFYYVRFSRLIEERLQGPVFPNVSQIYATPEKLRVGHPASQSEVVAQLRLAGYGENQEDRKGRYELLSNGIRAYPGPDSYFSQEPAELHFSDGKLSSIVSLNDQFARSEYFLEPLLITNLFDRSREKRRLVSFRDLPAHLVKAILATEDRRFFEHSGVDYPRILKAAYVDIRTGSPRQGASTITMQLARSLFLNRERTFRRKIAETMVAFQLERRLSKEEIFEHYCNTIYLGQRGSFSILGVGEAAQAYFRKDARSLTLPEAAFLAGIIRGPNLYSPYRNPEAAVKRRNQVLDAMVEIGAITPAERDETAAASLEVAPSYAVASEAPYFVDLVKDQLLERFSEEELTSQSYRVYTTLDLRLQRAAAEAVNVGIAEVDKRLAALRKPRRGGKPSGSTGAESAPPQDEPLAEVALVALDPHTGAIKALLGGRDYGRSQLNRILAQRQPGSVFKPFVYAAALASFPYGRSQRTWTPISKLTDEPTTFVFDSGAYEPANYGAEYYGEVTLRYALMRSLNVATVKVAESIGYDTVVSLARRAGMNLRIQPTPAVALGAYEVTPLEIAGAYTIFANQGVRVDPYFLALVRSRNGALLDITYPRKTPVLDPAVAFLMTNLLEDVINHGTGIGVRARGFTAPAAGKTGTSHDGWFAGYTSNLIVLVWVGFDSDRELPLSGAASALPIWTEFMKRAIALPGYSDVKSPVPPAGVVQVEIDPDTQELATPHCPRSQKEFFLEGTQPGEYCHLHYLQPVPRPLPVPPIARAASQTVGEPGVAPGLPQPIPAAVPAPAPPAVPPSGTPAPEPEKKKRGFFGRIFGIFTGGSEKDKPASR